MIEGSRLAITLIAMKNGAPSAVTTPVQASSEDHLDTVLRLAKAFVEGSGDRNRYSLACVESYDPSRPKVKSYRRWFYIEKSQPVAIEEPELFADIFNVWWELKV